MNQKSREFLDKKWGFPPVCALSSRYFFSFQDLSIIMSSLLKPQIILKGLSIRPCRQVLCSNVSTSTSGLFGAAQAAGSGAEDQSRFLAALEKYSIYQPTPVSIQHFIKFAQNSCAESSFAFLKHELPVRLANIMKELQLLPKQLHETHACKVSKNTYEKLMIIQFFIPCSIYVLQFSAFDGFIFHF